MLRSVKKIHNSLQKNSSEVSALLTGRMPKFVYAIRNFGDIPAFCFHSAQYPLFENQLQFLKNNGFETLTADELYERKIDKNYKNNGKEIVLTFDDGMASVYTVAFPLLQKYEQKIISFILPGLIEQGNSLGNTIDDVDDHEDREKLATRDFGTKPLCNWKEIKIMHDSGLVDFQSHGMNHALISISPKIVDFIHPGFDTYHYGNIHVPLYRKDNHQFSREKILGHPVYQNSPRLSGKPRYFDPPELRDKCAAFVNESGGQAFFAQNKWRSQLNDLVTEFQRTKKQPEYENHNQVRKEIEFEIKQSKLLIEKKLSKTVNHFCFPWFVSSHISSEIIKTAGYLAAYTGATIGFHEMKRTAYPLFIHRVQEEYLQALPGEGSRSLYQVFKTKFH